MSDDEQTRPVGDAGPDTQKTRLVRRREDPYESSRTLGKQDQATKTRLVMRPTPEGSLGQGPGAHGSEPDRFVAGWLVVVDGPGKGGFAAIYDGMNSIGRGSDQATRLDFGDDTISRSEHAFVTYDFKGRKFYIQHGGKASVVRLNDTPVLQPMELSNGDQISLGQTIVRFVAFCGENFDWQG